jgi:hypothetical protein
LKHIASAAQESGELKECELRRAPRQGVNTSTPSIPILLPPRRHFRVELAMIFDQFVGVVSVASNF